MTAAQTSPRQDNSPATSVWRLIALLTATIVATACTSAEDVAKPDTIDPAGPAWPVGTEIVCDDDPSDLDIYPHGDVGGAPMPTGWLEVEKVVLGRVQDQVVVEWTLSSAIPDDIGSSPGWGAQLADWTVVVHSGEGPWVVLSIGKEADKPLDIYADRFDPATGDIEVFDLEVDGGSVWSSGRVVYGRFPAYYLDGFVETSVWGAASLLYTLGDSAGPDGDFFDGWSMKDDVCGTVEAPQAITFGNDRID